ncbi:flagellar motor switch protein FliN [Buchnera aphidicola]|uniref:Flagellar motor switch protein FliN n=1 Tax=Buchnera aphidicola (Lipaphis pseudobrassicae) TaxID=1258543 RepID=A0A4D6Y737_9GAMM|nr:flagellar motor switch protein FliN [Buchnera aphidicola]QCI21971.1 flagellar motor switch protein FliN [Buchnera aphidicola (Lipaphis pseudobrassicae)]
MGKSNNLHNKFNKFYQRDQNLNSFLKKDEIEILENINTYFAKKVIINFSTFIKKNVRISSHSMKIESLLKFNRKNIKDISLFNSIKVLPFKHQFFLTYCSNFFSIIIDLLFGSDSHAIETYNKKNNITSTELLISKQITNIINNSLSNTFKKFFALDIKFINEKILLNFKQSCFNSNEMFLINFFNLSIDNIELYFYFLMPLSIIKIINETKLFKINNDKNISPKQDIINNIVFEDIHNIELDIFFKINDISISYNKFLTLSVGDVFLIENPDRIIGFLENKPIFFAKYKRFNEQSIVFIEQFIKNLKYKKIRNAFMSNTMNDSNHEKKPQQDNFNKNILTQDDINKNTGLNDSQEIVRNKNIIFDTPLNITVELGKSKVKIKDFLGFSKGSMLILDKLIKEPLDIFLNGHVIASGEIVVLENKYGIRITNVKNTLRTLNALS